MGSKPRGMSARDALLPAAVAVLVVLAGCSLGGSDTPTPTVEPGRSVDHPVEIATSKLSAHRVSVTVTREGETVYAGNLTLNGTTEFRRLTSLEASGEYRIRVDSNVTSRMGDPAGADRTVYVGAGGRTTVVVNPGNISVVQQPRDPVGIEAPVELEVREELSELFVEIRRDGETVYRERLHPEKQSIQEQQDGESRRLLTLNRSGTYQVIVTHPDTFWYANATAVLRPREDGDPMGIHIDVEVDGSVDVWINGAARRAHPWSP